MSCVRPPAPAPAVRAFLVAGAVAALAGCGSLAGPGGSATPISSVDGTGWFSYDPTAGVPSPSGAASAGTGTGTAARSASTTASTTASTAAAMAPDEFWAVVDRAADRDPMAAASKLTGELDGMTPERLVAYEQQFVAQMGRANTQRHRGAAEAVMGYTSEDVFVSFRTWVLFQGRAVYDAFVADPDSLAPHGPTDDEQIGATELLEGAAMDVWQSKTGRDPYADGSGAPDGGSVYDEPTGRPVDLSKLASLYPRLTAAYVGGTPSDGPAPIRRR